MSSGEDDEDAQEPVPPYDHGPLPTSVSSEEMWAASLTPPPPLPAHCRMSNGYEGEPVL